MTDICAECEKERKLKALDRIANELAYANDLKFIELKYSREFQNAQGTLKDVKMKHRNE